MLKNIALTVCCTLFFLTTSLSQNVGINNTGALPHASAILDIQSTSKGVLLPAADRFSIVNPAEGLLIRNSIGSHPTFYYYAAGAWRPVSSFIGMNGIVQNINMVGDTAFVFGSYTIADMAGPNDDRRFYFNKNTGALRAGFVEGDDWDPPNSGRQSVAFGHSTRASGDYSFAMGYDSHAMGLRSTAIGINVLAEGTESIAIGQFSHSKGEQSFAGGYSSYTVGLRSFGFGFNVEARGDASAAIGSNSKAIGLRSFAVNSNTTAVGDESAAFGTNTIATGESSFTHGLSTKAKSFAEFVIGRYNDTLQSTNPDPANWSSNDALFVAGNGSADNARSNAMTLYKDGALEIQKSIEVGPRGTPIGNMQARTIVLGTCSNTSGECNYIVNFERTFQTAPSVVIVTPIHEQGLSVGDMFITAVRNIATSGFTLIVKRIDAASSWGQQLRLAYIAIQ